MAFTIFDSSAKEREKKKVRPSVVTGTVINNCDLINQGKVLVRIPSLDQEVWARMGGVGAGSGAGFFYCPRVDDEVLVGLGDGEPADAFIISGLWNTQDSPPVSDTLDAISKRKIKTGLKAGVGHEVEFDDGVGQSIKITTTTKQQITLEPQKIEISTTGGSVKITLDLKTQAVNIQGLAKVDISTKGTLSLTGTNIQIGDATTVKTTIMGKMVMIN